jgi:hypothetical protein
MSRQKRLFIILVSLYGGLLFGTGTARAYEQYSENKDATNCRLCHGGFRDSPYNPHLDRPPKISSNSTADSESFRLQRFRLGTQRNVESA